MAIHNKDGTPYKISGPDPALQQQEFWKKVAVHNLKWKTESSPAGKPAPVPVRPEPVLLKDQFLSELVSTKPAQEKDPPVPPEPEPELPQDVAKTIIFCLPAIQSSNPLEYDSPFSFESVIVEQGDLTFQLWTTSNRVVERSVLYPKGWGEKRWWQVAERVEKTGGWLITSVPSSYQPSFLGL